MRLKSAEALVPKKKDDAHSVLESAFVFRELLAAFRRAGLVSEIRNALVVYIVATSRLLAKPLSLFIKGPSGVGKNFLADIVLRFFLRSEVMHLTSSSSKAWNYLNNALVHKIVYLKERNELAGPVQPLRLMLSEGNLTHVVTVKKRGKLVSETRVTKGPVAAISTTTKERVEIDDETRQISIWPDDTQEQTARIIEAAVSQEVCIGPTEIKKWHRVQQLIQKRATLAIEFPDWLTQLAKYVNSQN
jgi:hypothetical protein